MIILITESDNGSDRGGGVLQVGQIHHLSPVRGDDQVSHWGSTGRFPEADDRGQAAHVCRDWQR